MTSSAARGNHNAEALETYALRVGAQVTRLPGGGLVAVLAPARADDPGELIPIERAAEIVGVSRRTLRDAARSGELTLYGKQRSRTVRRGDLERWIESRRAPVERGTVDADIERRMARLRARKGRAA